MSKWNRTAGLSFTAAAGLLLATVAPQQAQAAVTICPGQVADNTGASDAAAAINACIISTPTNGTLSLPVGTYRLDVPVVVARSNITIKTTGTTGSSGICEVNTACAVLKASDSFFNAKTFPSVSEHNGMFVINGNDVTIDHLVFDGNRSGRLATQGAPAYRMLCRATYPGLENYTFGRNVLAVGENGSNRTIQYSVSKNAMCGTALGWGGTNARVVLNYVYNNGSPFPVDSALIADGITIGTVSNGDISSNIVADSTDVDIIIGGATNNSRMQYNQIIHNGYPAFAGIMLTNWQALATTPTKADFRGFDVSGNSIHCYSYCDIGMQLGVLTWVYDGNWQNSVFMGGDVHHNTINTTKQGINVSGAGDANYWMRLADNTLNTTYNSSTSLVVVPGSLCPNPRPTGKLNVPGLWTENFISFQNNQDLDMDMTTAWHKCY
ncbi:hypothetical protein [Corallococcus exiguus]|uniref:hypothetical protein n=1 Tax=Corallococcus exiguus TaxID=83462 RepID=UPI001F5F0757|nr:hypothetical protein [Corallococcus exiguus]